MKKLAALFLGIIMCFGLCIPANATQLIKEIEFKPEYVVYNSGKESAKLIDAGTHIVVITDKPAESAVVLNNSYIEYRESNATVYVPTAESHDKLYRDLFDELKTLSNGSESGSSQISGPDKNACATFFMTVDYTRKTEPDYCTYYAISSVSGGFTDSGTTGSYVGENVYVTNQALDVSQTGSRLDDGEFTSMQYEKDIPLSVSNRNWSYSPPSSWKAVSENGFGSLIGARYKFTLARGSSSWTTPLEITLSSVSNW